MKKTYIKNSAEILADLYTVVLSRKDHPRADSYVCRLLDRGKEKIHEKIREESEELVEASDRSSREEIVHEMADLWFHCAVLLGTWNIPPQEIFDELARRWGRSGLTEKANRKQNATR